MGNKLSRLKGKKNKSEWTVPEREVNSTAPSQSTGEERNTSINEPLDVPVSLFEGPGPEPEISQNTIIINKGEVLTEEQIMDLENVEIISKEQNLRFDGVWRLTNLRRLRITAPGIRISFGKHINLSRLLELEINAGEVYFGFLHLPNLQSLSVFNLNRIEGELSVPNLKNVDADLTNACQNQLVLALLPTPPPPQPLLKSLPVEHISPLKKINKRTSGSHQSFVSMRTPPAVVRRPGLAPLPINNPRESPSKMGPLPQDPLIKSALGTLPGF